MKAIVVKASGEVIEKEFDNIGTYQFLSESVGGLIQCVSLTDKVDMWLNEEGKMINLPDNPIATVAWASVFGETDIIVGDVVFTGGVDSEGETIGLSETQFDKLLNVLNLAREEMFVY